MKLKKPITILLTAVLLCGTLSACGDQKSQEPEVKEPEAPITYEDQLGAYDGTPIPLNGGNWDILGDYGWEFTNDNGLAYQIVKNPDYEDVELHLFNRNRADATRDDIIVNGFYGYDVICAPDTSVPMTWNGITFGASEDDIVGAYGRNYYLYTQYEGGEGEPHYHSVSADPDLNSMESESLDEILYHSYKYPIDEDTDLTFYVYQDSGLQEVRLDYYGAIEE